ncbi:MAG: SDR family NAD(P)-dependent oxidoreductase [Candidatus Eremiobacteraeota bacterium]|nr:SDR family NAD(P)-dependent oxidoreductase [Candidatus Eremiobacteraeota bacterium]
MGASGTIGSVTALALARRGATVVLAALPDGALETVTATLSSAGASVLAVPTDITQREDIDRLVATTLDQFGKVDILANVAGISSSPSLCDATDEMLEAVVDINLLGAARLMHAVLPAMKARRSGSIVHVGSVAGEAGVLGIYSASKFGLRGLCDSVRREVRSFGITVSLIEPGLIRSANPKEANRPGPQIVADAILGAIARPRRAVIVPWPYRLPVFLVNLFPGIADIVFGDARIQELLNNDARSAPQRQGSAKSK